MERINMKAREREKENKPRKKNTKLSLCRKIVVVLKSHKSLVMLKLLKRILLIQAEISALYIQV